MKVWIVSHPYDRRRWCHVRVLDVGATDWRDAYVWAEWNGPSQGEADAIVPVRPDGDHYAISNVDPLVFGPTMYFDYCRKGRPKSGSNLRRPNELDAGDLVLFGSMKDHEVVVDTVFVVGAWKPWPREPDRIPDWEQVDLLAQRVHFHAFAHEREHREVHTGTIEARSYAGRRHGEEQDTYCWIPFRSHPGAPMVVARSSNAFKTLQSIFAGKNIDGGFNASFSVMTCPPVEGLRLFNELLDVARVAGFGIAAGVDMLAGGERSIEDDEAEAFRCSQWERESDDDDSEGC